MNYYKRVDDLVARALKGEDVEFLLGQLGIVLDHLPQKTDISAPLTRKFKSQVDYKALHKRHEIEGYIIAALYFLLRDEKDNRIFSAKQLTKMRREETKDTVMRRFAGWASSIPVNRTITNKQEIVNFIVKPIKELPKHEKTIVEDQTRKMVSNMDMIVASEAGAIGYFWHSLFRVPGYNYREEHKHLDLDGKFIILKDSWAYKAGYIKRGNQIFQDDIECPGELPNCKCTAKYVYDINSVPKDCLTIKGLEYKKGL
jgi:hypothetical protein